MANPEPANVIPPETNSIVQNDVTIYPNPGSGQFKIVSNSGEEINSITVFDIAGRIVYEATTSSSEIDVDITTENKGIYFIRSNVNGNIKISKYINQ